MRFLLFFQKYLTKNHNLSAVKNLNTRGFFYTCLCMIVVYHERNFWKTFWTPSIPGGVISNHPCPSVCPSVHVLVFRYLRDRSLVFSETLHEVRGQLSKKSDTAEILKKNHNLGIKGD